MNRRWIANEVERTIYAIAGLPIAIRGASIPGPPDAKAIRSAFARRYWRPHSILEAAELVVGLLLVPLAVPLSALWFTARNGPSIRRREAKGLAAQFVEQLRLYKTNGVLGPWYYILSLHRDGALRAPTFLQRCETKRGIYALLKNRSPSPLGDKKAFADRCRAAGVRCVSCELVIDGKPLDAELLPDCDIFVKPCVGCGGKGAERWDRIAARRWSNGRVELGDAELIDHLNAGRRPAIVQKLVKPHPQLAELTSGAVPTVRVVTCLNERGAPEPVAAVFRMSMGASRIVDNIHAGGLACAVSLDTGTLGLASDLGSDARLGWCCDHPTTGVRIEGTQLPYWLEVLALAVSAHSVFSDRLLIGWDIAIAEDGPIVIEGNRGPDMDLMQRFMDLGFYHDHRLTELIAHHLRVRGHLDFRRSGRGSAVRMDPQRQ
jgi:hypothetical protein